MEYSTGILVAIATLLLTFLMYKKTRTRANTPPSLPWLPMVGSLPFISGFNPLYIYLTEYAKRYGPVFSFYAGQRYIVVLNGYEAIREALVKRSTDFAGREIGYAEHTVWNPDLKGIIFSPYNDNFKVIRKATIAVLKKIGFGERFTLEAKINEELNEFIECIRETDGKAFDTETCISMYVLSLIYNLLFVQRLGFKSDVATLKYILDLYNMYVRSIDPKLDLFVIIRLFPKYRQLLKDIVPESQKFKIFLDEKIKESLKSSSDEKTFVKEFKMEIGQRFDESDLYFITKDFIGAGIFTLLSQILWFILLVTNHPSIQERLRKEIDSVVPRDRLLSVTDKLPYLEATILEVMRLKTALPISVIRTTVCDTEVDGFFVPANTQVIANIWSAHMDSTVWPEPEKFRPERFMNDTGEVINRNLMISFSLGKRRCPGEILARQELFLILGALIQQFEFLAPEGQSCIPDRGSVRMGYFPEPFNVRLITRTY